MDRKSQLRNVAFGGAWSEQIAGNEALADAMALVEIAVGRTENEDLRDDMVLADAIKFLAKNHPKGDEMISSWLNALEKSESFVRVAELSRLVRLFRTGLYDRLKS